MVLLHLFINFPCLLSIVNVYRCLQYEISNWIGFLFKWQACATTGVKPEPWSANILWIDEFWAGGVTAYCLLKMGLMLFWNRISFFCCSQSSASSRNQPCPAGHSSIFFLNILVYPALACNLTVTSSDFEIIFKFHEPFQRYQLSSLANSAKTAG